MAAIAAFDRETDALIARERLKRDRLTQEALELDRLDQARKAQDAIAFERERRDTAAALDALERKLQRQIYVGLGLGILATLTGTLWVTVPTFLVAVAVIAPTWQRWAKACENYHRRYPF